MKYTNLSYFINLLLWITWLNLINFDNWLYSLLSADNTININIIETNYSNNFIKLNSENI